MNRTFFWKPSVVFALAASPIVSAQTSWTPPKIVSSASPAIHIIPIGSPLTFGGANAPDTYSATTTFSSTPVLVDNGAVKIWQDQVSTGPDGEWDVFHLETVNGSPLANDINAEWNIVMDYTLSAPVSFDAVAHQWAVSGTPVSPLSNFGGSSGICCAASSNPILPGEAYYKNGFSGLLPAGVQPTGEKYLSGPTASPRRAASTRARRTNSPSPCTSRSSRRRPPSREPSVPVSLGRFRPSGRVPGSKSMEQISPQVRRPGAAAISSV